MSRAADPLAPLYLDRAARPERVPADRLELLTALINSPGFDPLFRGDVVSLPAEHPTYYWKCMVRDCQRPSGISDARDLCYEHTREWHPLRRAGADRAVFLTTATPRPVARWTDAASCRICPDRPANRSFLQLCRRHAHRWTAARRDDPLLQLEEWQAGESPFPGFGDCAVMSCPNLAASPLHLCGWHESAYAKHGRPGGASLPARWVRNYDSRDRPTPVHYDDRAAFRRWCATAPAEPLPGQINLLGLHPLVKAEIQWGMFKHTEGPRARWPLTNLQALANTCREHGVFSLVDLDLEVCTHIGRLIAREMLNELRLIYFAPPDTRVAGFIETDHFGVRFQARHSHFSLTAISQRWLRELLWDFLASMLRSPACPTSGGPFEQLRRGCVELSAFLETDAPNGGHDPTQLRDEHMHRFVADQRHRERHGLHSLGMHRADGQPSTVSATTRAFTLNSVRRVLRSALESDTTDRIGLDRGFIVAAPTGGAKLGKSRRPFPDEVARALADEDNLRLLARDYDLFDSGLRDVWETLVATGRRTSEVLNLRLDCTEVHNGLPILWHDQTKVANYDEAIRIPEPIHQRLAERRGKTLARFAQRYGRPPTADERAVMALFPSRRRNSSNTLAMSYTWFSNNFRQWVDQLDIGRWVSHQARHTLATNLLRHGAGLHHIRRYLGHVSDRMVEYYAKVAISEIEDVLQHVWVAGPGAPNPGETLSTGVTPMNRAQANALALDLSRRSTPAEGGFCTFQPVVQGGACPWNLNCHNCDKFVLSGADLLYWHRKREQWQSIAERAPDNATADYLHQVFEPTARAIDGLEKALAAVGLLDEALALDLRRPQDYFTRVWSTAFRAADLAATHDSEQDSAQEMTA